MRFSKTLLVIGIGNELRGDDGIGPAIVKALPRSPESDNGDGVEIRADRGEDPCIVDTWDGWPALFLIDAICAGGEIGSLRIFDASQEDVPTNIFGRTTHTFSLGEMIALARQLGKLPSVVRIFGIEGKEFGIGKPISKAVAETIPRAVLQINEDIRRWKNA